MCGERKEQKKFNELIKKFKDNKFKYMEKEEKLREWSKYDKAQIHEINDMLLLIADFVDEAVIRLKIEKDSEKGPGRPSYLPGDLAKAILMQQYLGMANRSSEGLVILFKEKIRLSNTFSYKTIERSYEDPFVTLILNEVFKMIQEPISQKEHSLRSMVHVFPPRLNKTGRLINRRNLKQEIIRQKKSPKQLNQIERLKKLKLKKKKS